MCVWLVVVVVVVEGGVRYVWRMSVVVREEKFSKLDRQIGLTPGNRAFHIASLVVGSREYLLLLPRLRGWMGQTGWSGGVGGRAERPVWLSFLHSCSQALSPLALA